MKQPISDLSDNQAGFEWGIRERCLFTRAKYMDISVILIMGLVGENVLDINNVAAEESHADVF